MKCNSCSNEVGENARFCPFCGATMPENPQHQKEYEQAIKTYLLDGVLEPWEVRELALLRTRLNISEETHTRLLQTFDYVDHNTITLSIEMSDADFFRAEQQCQFRVLIKNMEAYPITRCTVSYQIMQNGEVFQSQQLSVGSLSSIRHTLPFVPQRSGQFELSGHIDIDDAQSHSYRYQFQGIHFHVAAIQVGITNTVTVGDNFTGVLSVKTPKADNTLEGGLNLTENWAEVILKPIPIRRNGVFTPASFSSQFAPLHSSLLHITRPSGEDMIEVFNKDAVVFGRDKTRSMGIFALEPNNPPHIYHHNIQKNQCISAKHVSFLKKGDMVHICDVGSKMGTTRNGEPCYRLSMYPIQTGDRISIAQVLELEAHVFYSTKHTTPSALLLKRTNNSTHKSHLILFDAIGLWPEHPSLVGALEIGATEAPLQLRRIDSTPYLCNVSCGTIHVQGLPLHNGEAVPLSAGQRIMLDSCSIAVASI